MSSLLNKVKAWVNSGVRGPRQYKRESNSLNELEKGNADPPEVTESSPSQEQLPEVTDAVVTGDVAPHLTDDEAKEPRSQVREQDEPTDSADAFEDERIVDLLKDQTKG